MQKSQAKRQALQQRAGFERRMKVGSVGLIFHKRQSWPPFWKPWTMWSEARYTRMFPSSSYEMRATATQTFLVVLRGQGVEIVFPHESISCVMFLPVPPKKLGEKGSGDAE